MASCKLWGVFINNKNNYLLSFFNLERTIVKAG